MRRYVLIAALVMPCTSTAIADDPEISTKNKRIIRQEAWHCATEWREYGVAQQICFNKVREHMRAIMKADDDVRESSQFDLWHDIDERLDAEYLAVAERYERGEITLEEARREETKLKSQADEDIARRLREGR